MSSPTALLFSKKTSIYCLPVPFLVGVSLLVSLSLNQNNPWPPIFVEEARLSWIGMPASLRGTRPTSLKEKEEREQRGC